MKTKAKFSIVFIICAFFLSSLPYYLFAQEYKYEIGGMAGTSFYMGDANKNTLFKSPQLAGGVVFRYNRDFRWAYKANIAIGSLSGDTKSSGNVFPYQENASFSKTFYEVGAQIEFNFFDYSDKYGFLGTKKFSPYMFTGIGLTVASGEGSNFTGMNLPLGIGLKYKIKNRVNLGFEFSFRKLFGDNLDQNKNSNLNLDNPYKIESSFLKNKDWYSLTMFSVTWDFGLRKDPCLSIDY